MTKTKNYKKTLIACYLGFITQAISANFTPLLFLTFKSTYGISLEMIAIETHVADARSCCLHPATTTHRQLSDADLIASGVAPDLVRLSCGLEDAEDLIADIQQALDKI